MLRLNFFIKPNSQDYGFTEEIDDVFLSSPSKMLIYLEEASFYRKFFLKL